MIKKIKVIFSAVSSALITILCYIVLHEAGHSLVAAFCGAKITEFSILGAYMNYTGGKFTTITYALFHASGMLFPIIISFLFMCFYRQGYQNIFYRIFSAVFSLLPFLSTIAWIFVPMLYLLGKAPENDDATRFINTLGLSPWIVCGVAILLLTIGIVFAWKKKIIQNYWNSCRG